MQKSDKVQIRYIPNKIASANAVIQRVCRRTRSCSKDSGSAKAVKPAEEWDYSYMYLLFLREKVSLLEQRPAAKRRNNQDKEEEHAEQ